MRNNFAVNPSQTQTWSGRRQHRLRPQQAICFCGPDMNLQFNQMQQREDEEAYSSSTWHFWKLHSDEIMLELKERKKKLPQQLYPEMAPIFHPTPTSILIPHQSGPCKGDDYYIWWHPPSLVSCQGSHLYHLHQLYQSSHQEYVLSPCCCIWLNWKLIPGPQKTNCLFTTQSVLLLARSCLDSWQIDVEMFSH